MSAPPTFSLTVKTDATGGVSNTNQMTLPFSGSVPAGTTLTIDWRSPSATCDKGTTTNGVTILNGGIDITNLTGTYLAAGTYTILISSSAPASQQQIPDFKFNQSGDAVKLITLNSPMLNTGLTSFENTFAGCSNLTSISEGLFSKNTLATNFYATFYDCSSLTAISEGLFSKNTKVTNFAVTFSGCSSLTTIPEGLFSNNTQATDFSYTFYDCSRLTAIPEGLFSNNTLATDFSGTFYRCSITAIPGGLFSKNTKATDFSYCFYGCTKAGINGDPFIGGNATETNRFTSVTDINFTAAFRSVASDESVTNKGNAPELWNYTFANGTTITKTSCFAGTSFANDSSIPIDWK